MKIEDFAMERWQSLHEHAVEVNLADSGVEPMTVTELVDGDDALRDALLRQRLVYTQTNGTPELRARIAALYPGASPEHVLAVNGGAEANFVAAWTLIEPGDVVVLQHPNYQQLGGLARSLGAEVREWRLRPDFEAGRFTADLDELAELAGGGAKLIAICNPNNPTGARLDAATLDAVARVAERAGAWLLADEIYQGSELDGRETPSVWGRTERVLVTNSLSKTYGLPGLRLGWVVAPPPTIDRLWSSHDYTTIGPGALSDLLAQHALSPARRAALLERTRAHLTANYARCSTWLAERDDLRHVPPEAGAMLWLRYEHPLGSIALAERLRVEQGVLVVPGAHYDLDGWLRLGFGDDPSKLTRGLERVGTLLDQLGTPTGTPGA